MSGRTMKPVKVFYVSSLITAVCAMACSQGRDLFIDLPAGAEGELLAIAGSDGQILEVLAGPFDDPILLPPTANPEPVRIEILSYDQPLAELGIDASNVLDSPICERRCALLQPKQTLVRALRFAPESDSGWQAGVRSDALADVLLPDRTTRCEQCAPLIKTHIDLPEETRDTVINVAVPGEQTAIIGHIGGGLWTLDTDLQLSPICRDWLPPNQASIRGAVRRGTSELWLIAANQLHELRLEEQDPAQPCAVHTSSSPEDLLSLVVSPASAPFEVFAIDRGGSVHRYDGEWEKLATIDSASTHQTLDWIAPGQVNASMGDERFFRVSEVGTDAQSVPVATGLIREMLHTEVMGSVFMLRDEGLWFLAGRTWTNSPPPKGWLNPSTMISLSEDSVLYTLSAGLFGRYIDGNGHCEVESGFTGNSVSHAATFGDGYVVFADITDTDNQIGVLSPERGICPRER